MFIFGVRRLCLLIAALPAVPLVAGNLDTTGVSALRTTHPALDGADQIVAQVEALSGSTWQVDPAAVGHPESLFDYYNSANPYGTGGMAFMPALASGHARNVAANFYGATGGAAPGVERVENFEAQYFWEEVVHKNNGATWTPVAIDAKIVNQSFIFSTTDSATIATVSRFYDAYVNQFGTLFVNAANNGSSATNFAPGSMYNGITVGRLDGAHSAGVHLVSPGGETSFSAPYVAGSAALLRQAAELGHFSAIGGTDPTDSRVLKAGLINGATKTAGWTQTETDPLDSTFGAGVVNVDSSHQMLAGGLHSRSSQSLESRGSTIPTTTPTNLIASMDGWDLATLSATVARDAAAHYFFDLSSFSSVTFTGTLTWNSIANVAAGTNTISDFDLVLIDSISDSVLWSSHGTTENVEHIHVAGLSGGTYEVQVILRGGPGLPTLTDTYALVWSWDGLTAAPEPGAWMAIGIFTLLGAVILRRRVGNC